MNTILAVGRWTQFAWRSLVAALASSPRVRLWRRPFFTMLVGGLPLAAVVGLSLGVVIWMHTRGVLEKTGTGAVEFLPTVLAAAVFLELAPIGAGLIVASRTAASLAAELASMKTSEQLDALQLLGVSPWKRLIGPRVWACILAVPLLHIAIATLAITSGFLAESIIGDTTLLKYRTAILRELYLADVVPAFVKTFAFGFLTGATATYLGSAVDGGAEEVGRAATDSVVACMLLVLASDVLLVGLARVLI
jgi:phospholipid/cholesterol/gamma-HCH transport system permease protein